MPEDPSVDPSKGTKLVANPPPNLDTAKYYFVERDEGGDLVVTISSAAPDPMPPKVLEFLSNLQFADELARDDKIVPDEKRRTHYAAEIASYAKVGLTHGDLDAASMALDWFERRVTNREGPEIRRRYLNSTLLVCAWVGIPALIAGILMRHAFPLVPTEWMGEVQMLRAGLFLAVGNALGIVFFAFFRNLDLRFDQLSKLDPSQLSPLLKFTLVWIITTIFAIFLVPKVLIVALGSYELNGFMSEPVTATIIGILCGYADATVGKILVGLMDKPISKPTSP